VIVREADLAAILKARHAQPHAVLGMHQAEYEGRKGVVVRAFLENAVTCEVVEYLERPERRHAMTRIEGTGFFEVFIGDRPNIFAYRLRVQKASGESREFYDPYCFLPTLSEDDLYLINQGNDHQIYKKLGSHLREYGGVKGVSFAVWAPSAKRVSVVGDFNHWDGRYHPMRMLGSSGIWELFIPGLETGMKYKYEILSGANFLLLKTDPYALYFEPPPHNASIIWDLSDYHWNDAAWMEQRAKTDWQKKPVSIYEVHAGSWKRVVEDGGRPQSYVEMAHDLAAYVQRMGFTHVQFMPLAEHPFTGSWGYQVTGFYAPTHRYGKPQEFMALVDAFHRQGIGVLLDWVPAHFPKDTFALAEFDGTHLYEHADPRQGLHQDWGTFIFNYGRHEVRGFLVGNALAWMERYHIDGLRVDAVASMLYLDYSRKEGEWVPNQYGGRENIEAIAFLRQTNELVHHYHPGVLMIAEESTAFGGVSKPVHEGGLGFDFKWNMGWMHDTLEYFKKEPIHRKWQHDQLTFPMLYQYSEKFISVFSHDEVVHGKGSLILKMGSWTMTDKARTLRALYAMMWMWPGKKCLFMGQEWGQSGEWHYDKSLEWHLLQYADHEGTQLVVRDLNHIYTGELAVPALDNDPAGFQWINCHDGDNSIVSFLRYGADGEPVFAVVCNFTPVPRTGYRIGLPRPGVWKEVLNTDAGLYGGTGLGNLGAITAEAQPWDHREYSAPIASPGLSTVVFRWERPATSLQVPEPAAAKEPEAPVPAAIPAAAPEPDKKSATPKAAKKAAAAKPKKPKGGGAPKA
jgi:1,4-alpha-glucan branching enzyme